jgi:flavin-dependent dehydrogenase
MGEKNNIAVIGAGIIGLYLAWRLKEKGFEVTVFEKRDMVGTKPCSSLISERIKKFIPIPDTLYQRKAESVLVHFPKKDIKLKPRPPFLVFTRKDLDEFVFNLAKKQGVNFVFGREVNKIPQGFSKVIGCDGALSHIRKLLCLPSPDFRLGIQYFIKTDNFSSGIDPVRDQRPLVRAQRKRISNGVEIWPKIFKGSLRHGFFWKIPKMGEIEYGAIGPSSVLKKEFEKFCQRQGIGLKLELELEKLKVALIPQGICLPNSENITLCGDAAGLTKPTTGGGVIWGLTAADILIKHFSDFRRYKKEAERFFKPKILKGKLAISLGYFLGNHSSLFLPKNIPIDADLF